jgi:hypothetical protein
MKTKNDEKKLPISLLIPFTILILINLLWAVKAIITWFYIPKWGWSIPLKAEVVIISVFISIIILIAISLISRLVKYKVIVMVSLIILCIISGWMGVFIFSHPFSPNPPRQEVTFKQLGISRASIFQMSACDRVEKFADAGYQYIDVPEYSSGDVALPDWFHQSLADIPKNILISCMKDEITKQLQYVHGDSWEREVTTKKIYALLYESARLNLLDSPVILEIENIVVCQKRLDVIGTILPFYYIGQYGDTPTYNYFSDDGKARLLADVCKP